MIRSAEALYQAKLSLYRTLLVFKDSFCFADLTLDCGFSENPCADPTAYIDATCSCMCYGPEAVITPCEMGNIF